MNIFQVSDDELLTYILPLFRQRVSFFFRESVVPEFSSFLLILLAFIFHSNI